MGEHELHTDIPEVLGPLLARFLATRGEPIHVGSDHFIDWVAHDPTPSIARVAELEAQLARRKR